MKRDQINSEKLKGHKTITQAMWKIRNVFFLPKDSGPLHVRGNSG